MTKFNPSERISIQEILSHPWINNPDMPKITPFRKIMEYRVQQVSQYYREIAEEAIENMKGDKKNFTNDEYWEIPESLEHFLFSLKPRLLRLQKTLNCSNSDSFDSSSDSSSIYETETKQEKSKAQKKYSLGLERANSFDNFSSDHEYNE